MKLSEHVRSPWTDARIERQWSAIESALPQPGARSRSRVTIARVGGVAIFGAAALAWALMIGDGSTTLPSGARVESARAEVAVSLEDGSRVQLAPESQLRLVTNKEQAVQLELSQGSAQFAVSHQKRKLFAVKVGAAEIRVIGTRFRVLREQEADGLRVTLRVQEGVVEVSRSDVGEDEPRRVRAGETWSALLPTSKPPSQPSTAATEPALPRAEPVSAPTAELALAKASEPARIAAKEPPRASEPAKVPVVSASELFLRANVARRAGRMQDAALEYSALLERFPNDSRAGLSAFELGRLRMDALGDPRRAVEALEQSLRTRGSSSFHEDALARIVIAYDALAQPEPCQRARERYLARYPHGVHAAALAQRCQ